VVVCSEGYPGEVRKGLPITGLIPLPKASSSPTGALMFHSGTKAEKMGKIVTNGGRVVGPTALGATLAEATRLATLAAGQTTFPGAFFRKDIGHRIMNHAQSAK
jgi:phosphoribosylamine---glycine ligase